MTTDHPQISICIPAYDMDGQGGSFLAASLDRLTRQSFRQFEIVVSDQSVNRDVSEVCEAYEDRLSIRRVAYSEGPRQASANTNNAMRHARAEILKILFQDDFLCADDALEKIMQGFADPDVHWALCGSAITRDGTTLERPMVPRLNPNLHLGRNTVSSPSVLALRAGPGLAFDETLIWLMDVEFYKRCADELGAPYICPEILVANRLHPGQVSAQVDPALRRRELAYVREKHAATETLGNRWHYLKQKWKAR